MMNHFLSAEPWQELQHELQQIKMFNFDDAGMMIKS